MQRGAKPLGRSCRPSVAGLEPRLASKTPDWVTCSRSYIGLSFQLYEHEIVGLEASQRRRGGSLMPTVARPLAAIALFLSAAIGAGPPAIAQDINQIELTDQQVTAFIAAQKDFAPLSTRLLEGGEKPDEALTKELEAIAKKHAFKSFAEFEDVGANITIVLDGLDRSTGTY